MTIEREIDFIGINKKFWETTSNIFGLTVFHEVLEKACRADFLPFDNTQLQLLNNFPIQGMDVVQIGCNNGLELIGLKKMGAEYCLGIDFSKGFIGHAKNLSNSSGHEVEFLNTNIYDLKDTYNNRFDLVFISEGVLGWMPTLSDFFKIASHLLRPSGQIFIYEQHPILGMFNPYPPHSIEASYFRKEPFKDDILPEYINKNADLKAISYWFPHTIADVITGCIAQGINITHFQEYAKDISQTYMLLEKKENSWPLSFSLIGKKIVY